MAAACENPPMQDTENLYIEVINPETASCYEDVKKRGKWMMFFRKELMNKKWEKAKDLYNNGKLPGIISIKTSTAAVNPRTSCANMGAIRFKCGPSDNESLMKEYGEMLVKEFSYTSTTGFISYKTDKQSEAGTRATGVKVNFTYRIAVPKGGSRDKLIETPLSVTNSKWIEEMLPDVFNKLDKGQDLLGYWSLHVKKAKLNETWKLAVKLYREGKLEGISKLCSSTAKDGEKFGTGLIQFHCSPCNRRNVVTEYGKNLLEHFAGVSASNWLVYRKARKGDEQKKDQNKLDQNCLIG